MYVYLCFCTTQVCFTESEGLLNIAETIPGKFYETSQKFLEKPALLYKKDHTFGYIPYKRLLNLVENFTLSLEQLGVKKNDRVVLISENRPEWVVADLSVKSLGATLVPIHKVFTSYQIKEISYEVEPVLFIVSDASTYNKVHGIRMSFKKNTPVIHLEINQNSDTPIKNTWDFISALQWVSHNDDYKEAYRKKLGQIDPSGIATIIYIPSSDGRNRGVQLTHKNFVSNAEDVENTLGFGAEDSFLSVLPLSHALEKTVGCYVPLFAGARISYLTDISRFSKEVKSVKPSIIIGVPRLYEKTYQKSIENINKSKLGKMLLNNPSNSSLSKYLADKLVYKKVKSQLGGNIRFMISGGAALNIEVGKFFIKAGIPLLGGYGLTEAAPVVSVNRLDNYKPGTAGQLLPNVKVKIANDGEILIKGPNVMSGYLGDPTEGAGVLEEGWLKTGDYGELDENGFLKITGKKKRIIVLSNGKNVSPVAIEEQLVKSRYIKEARVIGDGEKHISAQIVPEIDLLRKHFPNKNGTLLTSSDVKDFVQKDIDSLLKDFIQYEQVRYIYFISKLHSNLEIDQESLGEVLNSPYSKGQTSQRGSKANS